MIGLSTALLKKPKPAEDLASGLPLQLSTVLCAGVCLLFIVTGSPGNLPIFLFLGVLLVVRRSLVRPMCYRFLLSRDVPLRLRAALLLLAAAVAVTFLVVVVDVSLQSREGQGLVYSRSAQSQGFRADQGFIGLSDMALERVGVDGQPARDTRRVFEKATSLAVASVALPVLALFRMSLSDITAFDRIAGSFPRGEFTAALVLAAALYALVVIRLGHPLRPLLIRVMTEQAGLWLFGALVNADVLPGILQPSSAWQIAPSILAVNVFLTAVLLWSQETRRTRTVRALCQVNLVLAAMWTALQLAVFSVYPTAHAEFPDRNQPFDVDHPALATWLSESADKTSRLALAVTKDHFDNSGRIVSLFLAVSLVERPVFAPSPTKIRSNEHLNQSLTLDSGVPPINLASWRDPQELAKLLSFLQVERLVVPLDDPVLANSEGVINQLILRGLARESAELRLPVPASDNTINKRTLHQSDYGLRNFELQTFSLFAPSSNRGATITKCPLLSDSCELLEQLSPLDPSDAPQVEVCRSGCLWSVKVTATSSAESQLILPIKFAETLTVTEGGEKLPTFDYAGFLGVNLPPNTDSPSLFVRFDLNATSMLRVLSSYLNSIAVIVVSLSLMIGRTRREWRSQVVRRICSLRSSAVTHRPSLVRNRQPCNVQTTSSPSSLPNTAKSALRCGQYRSSVNGPISISSLGASGSPSRLRASASARSTRSTERLFKKL